jgi:hypothetical protein
MGSMDAKRAGFVGLEQDGSVDDSAPPSDARAVRTAVPALPTLAAVRCEAIDAAARKAVIRAGGEVVEAVIDPAVSISVLRTAIARGERVIVEAQDAGWVVIGALRTAATPGVDEGEEFRIQAGRVTIDAAHELSFVTGAASLVLRAYGHVETLADNITARASSMHKIIGRMIRLN